MIDPCKDASLLSALLDGELSGKTADAVKRHVEGCRACRDQLAALERADGMVRKMPVLAPSADFNRTFWQKVEQLEASPRRLLGWRWWLTGWRPMLAGGLAGLAVAVYVAMGPQKALTPEEMFIADNIELLDDFEVIRHLDMLESWEALDTMETQS